MNKSQDAGRGTRTSPCSGSMKITTRKVCRNPEAWAAFIWRAGFPFCVGDEFVSRKEAIAAAKSEISDIESNVKNEGLTAPERNV